MAHGKGRCRKTVARSADGNGLYLTVQPTGSRSWIQRIRIHGRRRDLGLGSFPLVSLREARERAFVNRKTAREGGDPVNGERSHLNVPTFAEAAKRVWEDNRPGWRHGGHAQEWMSSLSRHVLPHIGGRPVSSGSSAEILDTLRRIWHSRPETARRVRQRIKSVMDWAVAMEYRGDNPCERIGPVLGPQQSVVEHMRALPHGEVAEAIRKMRGSGATEPVKLAFEFLVLTAARSGEVRGARWDEIDLSARVWAIPAGRMKSKRGHRVPLCGRAMEILEAARKLGDGSGPLVFPSRGGKPISITRLARMLSNLKVDAVPHGFRSSFRDWAAERTNHPREVVEAALAHVVANQTEAAYARSDLFERRRRLMDDWAAYLGGQRR
ncbi:MAG: tyrosine-type recombinase/integrase [Acidobacteria bacterium]|nr:tyrosine-type recombinase/integrase [Acidobacteriota bacterium]